jgi:acid phosphatase type 7
MTTRKRAQEQSRLSEFNRLNRRDMLKSLATVAAAPLLLSNFGCTVDRILSPQFDAAGAGPFTLIGAGDQHAVLNLAARGRTAAQVKRVLDANPSALAFAIGDLTHTGRDIEYQQYYHQSWGQFKARTIFGIGNHDTMYALPRGAAYYAYTKTPKYYARTLGNNWRVYVLTCMNATEGGVDFTEQLAWLKADLAQYSATHHILAMVHYPMFASVCEYHLKDMTSKGRVGPMWEALQGAGCEFLVSGHAHRYERLRPMLRDGTVSNAGIRQFVVGTGGVRLRGIIQQHPNSEKIFVEWGVVRYDLYADRYEWKFINQYGVVRESGLQACRKVLASAAAV